LRPGPIRATIAGVEPVLMTERLVLRRFTAADVDGLLALDGDPAVMRFLDSQIKSRAEIEAEVLPRFLGYYQRYRDFGFWAADTRDGGGFIGWFCLRPVAPAAAAMVRRAFAELGVTEVVATTMAVNTGSRAVLAKAGLRYARTVHLTWPEPLPGNEDGDVEYRLSRQDWLEGVAGT